MMKKPALIILLAVCTLVLVIGAMFFGQRNSPIRLALKGVQNFHEYYNRHEITAVTVLLNPDPEIRAMIFEAIKQGHKRWGKQLKTVSFSSEHKWNEVTIIYHSLFENGTAQERFVWDTNVEPAQLRSYQITPDIAPAK